MNVDVPKDVFGRVLREGDYIAAGMAFGRSTVLRVGQVISVAPTKSEYSSAWNIRVKWRNNGNINPTGYRSREVRDSTIKWEPGYSFAKFVIMDKDAVEQYPADIGEDDG